jgi:hypothetical protein
MESGDMGSSKSDRNSLCVFSDVDDPLTCVFGSWPSYD